MDRMSRINTDHTGPRTDIDRVERTFLSARIHNPRALHSKNRTHRASPSSSPWEQGEFSLQDPLSRADRNVRPTFGYVSSMNRRAHRTHLSPPKGVEVRFRQRVANAWSLSLSKRPRFASRRQTTTVSAVSRQRFLLRNRENSTLQTFDYFSYATLRLGHVKRETRQ